MSARRLRSSLSLLVLCLVALRAARAPDATLDGVLGTVALETLVLVGAWWLCATVALALARLPGAAGRIAGRVADAVTPTLLRRLAAATAGAAVAAAPAAPALALGPQTTGPGGTTPTATSVAGASAVLPLDRLPDADWPGGVRPGGVRPVVRPVVVVRAGDTLWDIAARHLGPDATREDVAREWPRWWRANAAVVGRDPDLLRPGQVLTAPPAER